MTKTSTIARPLLALAAALIAVPLAAKEQMTVTGRPVTQERVSYADLDLRTWSGRQTVKTRVSRASERVCDQAEGPYANNRFGLGSSPTCAELTFQAAKPQIAAAVRRAGVGQQLAVTAVVVSAPRGR